MGRIGREKKENLKNHVAVYFTKDETKEIMKQARKNLLDVSPFIRKTVLDTLKINVQA